MGSSHEKLAEPDKRKDKRRKTLGLVAIAIAAVAFVALVGRSLFPSSSGVSQVTAVLVDGTDEITRPTREAIITRIIGLAEDADSGDVFLIASLGDRDDSLSFAPLDPKDRPHPRDCSRLTCNPALADSAHQAFVGAVQSAMTAVLLGAAPAPRSYIMEGVREISVSSFRRPPNRDRRQRLIVISDLLQNSPSLSLHDMIQRRERIDPTIIRSVSTTPHTELTGVAVEIYYISRRAALGQSRTLADFWSTWIEAQGGQVEAVHRLEGGFN